MTTPDTQPDGTKGWEDALTPKETIEGIRNTKKENFSRGGVDPHALILKVRRLLALDFVDSDESERLISHLQSFDPNKPKRKKKK